MHVLAVDGNSMAHRAFHAVADEERVGAWVTGTVARMLATAWAYGPYDGVVVAFDHRVNRRKLEDPGYKAHRDDTDPDLRAHLERLPEHLAGCGFTVVCEEGAEADDLLATAADGATAAGWRCTVLSSDRDLTALVSDTVTLLRPRGTMTDLQVTTPPVVEATYGVRPEQYTDFAALRGDPSDGLVGCHGIGPKTAARLLRDYGSIPGIYAELTNLPPRLEAQLRAGRAEVERNLWLMAPIPGLEVDVEAAVAAGVRPDTVEDALRGLGEERAAGHLRGAIERPPLPPLPPTPDPTDLAAVPPPPAPLPPTRVRADVAALDGEQVALF
ncbi:MAG: 5'-3' exonuclease H3TH domain-containing protein [Actinomycetes bacterium]